MGFGMLTDAHAPGLVVKPDVANRQLDAERATPTPGGSQGTSHGYDAGPTPTPPEAVPQGQHQPTAVQLKHFHGMAVLDATRVGRDASRIADEVIAHLVGLVGSTVTVTIEVEAEIPDGAPDHVVRTVTENARTLKFTSQGFEKE